MKDVAPFLGLLSSTRRAAQREVWRAMPPPGQVELLAAADALWGLPEREFQYAAAEMLGRFGSVLGPEVLDRDLRRYVITKPWWDTVDLLGSQVINPLLRRRPDLVDVIWRWNRSGDQWLIRASIQHQRGRRGETDVALVLALCEPHAADRRFFVAKAIGWALRDLAAVDAAAVEQFLRAHPDLPAVARREAVRGINRQRT